ncbi:HTH domain-containing protein [Tetragenococcus koreensis]|uniref:Uncharacterized protein n=2 Tax=Tetragenococcus koreensis TaxID=290335 RepID=A0AAN4UAQ6_9ENTE|nr:HTH domain-containing protein [Tetragenococcus koreensis]MDN5831595.1 hypothetical protein [Tetragenococcus halophilus]MCF1618430.1 hypothetical protein [Tetragenococcus koreensis]MCF1623192.1 hypothetical protein [Tetragenococcus koreensis]MCF1679240.1 hypothetical protein [Tetragenococcus koreensis]MCF1681609.1 hypothetical protein [Tetragenococcus koreensis]
MGKNYFTEEQIAELNLNPNVQKVSTKAITYTEAFRQWFYQEYQDGKMPSIIFQEAGFDTNVLGKQRIQNFSKRTKNMAQRLEGFTDLRAQNTGRPRNKEHTTEQELDYLRHKVALQEQQIDALKKTNFINRQAARATPKRNSNSSKP